MESNSHGDKIKSPKIGVWLLEIFIPSESVKNLIGDLQEEHRRRVLDGEPDVARMEFWSQVGSAIGFYGRQSMALKAKRLISVATLTLLTLGPHGSEPYIKRLLATSPLAADVSEIKIPVARVKTNPNRATARSSHNDSENERLASTNLPAPDPCVWAGDNSFICRDGPYYYYWRRYDGENYVRWMMPSEAARSFFPNNKDLP